MRASWAMVLISFVAVEGKPFAPSYELDDGFRWHPPSNSHHHRPPVPILRQHFETMQDGSYKWNFEGADGSSHWSEAAPAWTGAGVRGEFGYSGPEGPVAVTYIADKHGFQPTGNAIHPDIMRAVALQVAKAKSEPEGMYDEQGFPIAGFHHHHHLHHQQHNFLDY